MKQNAKLAFFAQKYKCNTLACQYLEEYSDSEVIKLSVDNIFDMLSIIIKKQFQHVPWFEKTNKNVKLSTCLDL